MSIPSFCAFGVKSGCTGAELWFNGEKDPCGRNRGTSWNNRAHVCAMRALRPSFSAASAPSVLFDSSGLCAELAPAVVLPVQAIFLRKLQTAQIAVVVFEVRGLTISNYVFMKCITKKSELSSQKYIYKIQDIKYKIYNIRHRI